MSLSHLGRAVLHICEIRQTTAQKIARHAGLHHTMLSRAGNGGRLEAKSLRALCTSQPDARDGVELLLGHLRDEIERSGVGLSEIKISADDRVLEGDIRQLAEEAKVDAQLREVLRQLAVLVRMRPLPRPLTRQIPNSKIPTERSDRYYNPK